MKLRKAHYIIQGTYSSWS